MAPFTTPKRASNPSTSAHHTIPVPMPPIFSTPPKPAPYSNALKGQLAAASHRAAGLAISRDLIDHDSDLFWSGVYCGSKPLPELSPEDTKILDKQYRTLTRVKKERRSESLSYRPIAIILNVLTLAHNTAHPLPRDLVIVHVLNPDQYLFGDTFDARLKPDIIAYVSTLKYAQKYLDTLKTGETPKLEDLRPYWSQLSAVAELKVSANPEAQLLHYLQTTLRYRPDFSFAIGLASRLRGFTIYRLSTVNATVNPPRLQEPYSWTKKNTPHLQKYIAAIYHAEEARYNDMTFGLENRKIWTLVKEPTMWEIFPFHCGRYPGRGTWVGAAVEVGDASQSAIRIVKFYWADVRARWEEGPLYEQAHAQGVIPGLAKPVQHWKTGKTTSMSEVASPEECESTPVPPPLHSPEPVPAVEEQESKLQRSQQIREQYCVMLGTHGKPLNNCKTVLHILWAMFDVLITHRAMCEQDVLHRDISWGNVLVDPVYDTEPTDPGGSKDGRYWYSASIFGKASPNSGKASPNSGKASPNSGKASPNSGKASPYPTSLLMDLDQASRLSGEAPKSTNPRQERTGTPMFIATEITTGRLFTRFGFEIPEFLNYLETLPWDNLQFEDAATELFTAVGAQLEHLTKAQLEHLVKTNNPKIDVKRTLSARAHPAPASSNTPISHEPQHDAESVFWLLWFLLARANPKDHQPVAGGSHEQVSYDSFCNTMLGHTVGNPIDGRAGLMKEELSGYEYTLHPQFKSLGKMLYWMGQYLQIPRDKCTHRYHAHDMMQLLLLSESAQIISSGVAEIALDTTQPRPATRYLADIKSTPTPVESRATSSYCSDSQGVSVGQGAIPTPGSTGQKRKRTAEADDNVPNKRHSGNSFGTPSSSTRQKMRDRPSTPDSSGGPSDPNAPMDESTENEITKEFETQTNNQAQYKSEETHAQVKALQAEREQVRPSVEVASKMQTEMFQAEGWFALRPQKVN